MGIESLFGLPFDTNKNPLKISQGRNGPWSHYLLKKEIPTLPGQFKKTDLMNAIDFALPLGTPVWAARPGIIRTVWHRSNWCYEGLDPEIGNDPPFMSTNFVVIEQDNGSFSWYSHLNNNVLVKTGQRVAYGDVIGLTGKSGWIAEIPHLHFQCNQNIAGQSIPVSFWNYSGPLDHQTLLAEGKIYFG